MPLSRLEAMAYTSGWRLCLVSYALLFHQAHCFVTTRIPYNRQPPARLTLAEPKLPLFSSWNPIIPAPISITSTTSTSSLWIRAALTLGVSAGTGLVHDHRKNNGLGALITLLLAAHSSNLNLSPSSHALYTFCWTTLLPASLAFLFLASPSPKDRESSIKEVEAVSVPFFIGILGSVLGCVLSFLFCLLGANNHERTHKRILVGRQHYWWTPGRLLLPPVEAAVHAGCLCGSYVGGPVNFFGVNHLLTQTLGHDGGVSEGIIGSSVSDLLLMALYYSATTASLSSSRLRKMFPGRPSESSSPIHHEQDASTTEAVLSRKRRTMAVLISTILVWAMLAASKPFDARVVSGMIAALGAFGSLTSRLLPKALGLFNANIMDDVRAVSTPMSDVCFYLLFAAIGVSSVNLRSAIVHEGGWHFLSSCFFDSTALVVHIVTMIAGSLAVSRLFPSKVNFSLEEIMVASNSGIGGPVTAAAFAKNASSKRQRGLVMAATVWGVFGYAIGTELGVALTKHLLKLVP